MVKQLTIKSVLVASTTKRKREASKLIDIPTYAIIMLLLNYSNSVTALFNITRLLVQTLSLSLGITKLVSRSRVDLSLTFRYRALKVTRLKLVEAPIVQQYRLQLTIRRQLSLMYDYKNKKQAIPK